MPLVEVNELFVSFGARPAVDGVSFAIRRGERLGLIGESGSGKTLTALAIAGLLPPGAQSAGTIKFGGKPLPERDADMAHLRGKHIGMVFQEPMTALNPLMKAGAQIGEAVALHFPKREREVHVESLLKEVGLEPHHAQRYPHQLSGGQRQRVMIAIALAAEPELLICDEPTSALDLITQRRILTLLSNVCQARNMALLFISHDLKAVACLCRRILVLRAGLPVETGEISQIFQTPRATYTKALIAAAKAEILPFGEVSSKAALFAAHNVTRRFPSTGFSGFRRIEPFTAVNNVSLAIGAAEAVALAGPSGSGKSTLARMIAGLDRADAGEFSIDGQRYGGTRKFPRELRREISLVFQDPFGSFDPRLCVGASIAEPLRLVPDLSQTERQTRIREVVAAVGLDEKVLARYPHEFSGGQRQRLAIARALVTHPRLVVLDEPVSALDVSLRGDILKLLNRLRGELGLAYLVISHDLDMVRGIADRILVMQAGRIVEEGAPDIVFNKPQHELTRALLAARLPEPGAA